MTYEELNEVRELKSRILKSKQKLQALRDCVKPAGIKYTRETILKKDGKKESYTCLDVSPKSHKTESVTETLAIMISDTEKELTELQKRLVIAIPALTKKIQAEITNNTEQTLMIYRYVACEYFRDIGFKMGYSEQHIYFLHNRIIKKLRVDES